MASNTLSFQKLSDQKSRKVLLQMRFYIPERMKRVKSLDGDFMRIEKPSYLAIQIHQQH